ncbi:hypothetical protein HYV84_03600 [Candidatus Woesearchaeota archaeon]|nr:hypothetical protein [Candidatus Woesearchaeota archaeon]
MGDEGHGYLKAFDGYAEVFEKFGIEPVVLLFNPLGSNIHLPSYDWHKGTTGMKFAMSAARIAKHIGATKVIGPWAYEHQRRNDFRGGDAVVRLKAVGDEAEN